MRERPTFSTCSALNMHRSVRWVQGRGSGEGPLKHYSRGDREKAGLKKEKKPFQIQKATVVYSTYRRSEIGNSMTPCWCAETYQVSHVVSCLVVSGSSQKKRTKKPLCSEWLHIGAKHLAP